MKDRHAGHVVRPSVADYAGGISRLRARPSIAAIPSTDRTRISGIVVGALVGFGRAGSTPR